MDVLAVAIRGLAPQQNFRIDPVECTQVSPFLVKIAGAATSVPAELIEGSSFALNERGYCIWVPGSVPPLCFTTS